MARDLNAPTGLDGQMARDLRRPLLPCRGLRSGIFEQRKAQSPRRIALLDWLIKELENG